MADPVLTPATDADVWTWERAGSLSQRLVRRLGARIRWDGVRISETAAAATSMVALIRDIEWSAGATGGRCPICWGSVTRDGHRADCRIFAVTKTTLSVPGETRRRAIEAQAAEERET